MLTVPVAGNPSNPIRTAHEHLDSGASLLLVSSSGSRHGYRPGEGRPPGWYRLVVNFGVPSSYTHARRKFIAARGEIRRHAALLPVRYGASFRLSDRPGAGCHAGATLFPYPNSEPRDGRPMSLETFVTERSDEDVHRIRCLLDFFDPSRAAPHLARPFVDFD